MEITTIRNALDSIYEGNYANLNLFIPERLYIHGLSSTGYSENLNTRSPDNLKTVLRYMASNSAPGDRPTLPSNNCPQLDKLQTVGGLGFTKVPLERDGVHLTAKKANNENPSLTFTWLNDREGKVMSFLDAWRDLLFSQFLRSSDDSVTYRDMLRARGRMSGTAYNDSKCGIGEGTLVMKYVQILQSGKILELGELVITGLLPIDISGIDKVGPGLGAASKIPECTCSCIYSIGYIQFYSTGRKIYLK